MVIQTKNMKKHYEAFELNCSLEVKEGYVTGLIGQNGAGKSTAFKGILNLISLDGGMVSVFGKDVKDLSNQEKGQLGVVLSNSGFSNNLNVLEIASVMQGMYADFDKSKFLSKCEHFQLPVKKKTKTFSSGMHAKLRVLLALSHETKALILDEPTSGLDVVARNEILDLLREYMEKKESHAILISSHISTDLEGLCDNLYMIHGGKIILNEDTDILLSHYGLLKVSEEQFKKIDRSHLIRVKKEGFGYQCLTDQRQFYQEKYQGIVIEKGSIDDVISMSIKGDAV